MNPEMSGSPIFARHSVNLIGIIGIIAAILFVLFVVYLVYRMIYTYRNSPAYVENQKKQITTYSNITETAKKCRLLKDERDLLWRICRENKTPNILYLARDPNAVENLLKSEFSKLDQAGDENAKYTLFQLRPKLLNAFNQAPVITLSKNVPDETVFTYTASKGIHYQLKLAENTNEGLLLSVPASLSTSNDKPESLSRIILVFQGKGEIPYEMDTRVVRYQTGKDRTDQMLVVHTDRLRELQRRQAPRIEIVKPCKFSPVKVSALGIGKAAKVQYTPSEKKYDGTLIDISTGGCRIITSLPIQPQQNIYVEGPFNGKNTDSAIGLILRNTKRRDNQYVLHIKFLKIEKPVLNRIEALAYGYGTGSADQFKTASQNKLS